MIVAKTDEEYILYVQALYDEDVADAIIKNMKNKKEVQSPKPVNDEDFTLPF